jgi:hypothetical protein
MPVSLWAPAPRSDPQEETELDAATHLRSLVGKTIPTLTGKPNRVLEVRGGEVIVGTGRSPNGQPVPIQWVQEAIDELLEKGEIEISVKTVGYRSAFIGAVLATLPGAAALTSPRRVQLR